ncbi:mycofactocin system FadH/OYE family oxidoreductase 1 [Amycolatopsis taiwanensis]|uniref:Oxidoreductase n=1 Tax=Amycolatopsis taiwanensis TaxID=342230 RepID=A0A9W6RCJ1_9PSEU|nr:mycofactocin system FadH/OYE family oxidoreductase 1 [Amycolatopsis taiwanensis]GLY71425.1 oxidoreductase [Amycolatopsis taiwanensis]
MITEPVELAGRRVPSRVLFGPHETNLARGRVLSDRHVAYYARRAAGGAGIIVTETASVHEEDWPYERAPLAALAGPGWSSIVAACRPALVLAGLGHAGSQGSSAYSQSALWAPSRVPDVASRELPMELEPAQIRTIVDSFGESAALAVASGLDGVELDAGQYSLLRQFTSGLTNHRGDAYGTDRTRLLREVIQALREALGEGRVLGLRLSCDELAPWAGITPEDAAGMVADLAGSVDYLVPVRGSAMSASATRPDLHTEPGFNLDLCRRITGAVEGRTRTVLQGSVVDPEQAGQALGEGVAALVEMTRAQIADPDLVAKVRAGRPVRPCVLANQKCRVRDNRNPIVSCIGEPRSGHETTDPEPEGTDAAREVLVVGGGPAGLEAARVLALRGHRVELAERSHELGGMVRVAARVAGRERLARLVEWLEGEVRRLGVRVSTGVAVTEPAASMIVATGSVPGPRGYAVHSGVVVDVVDFLAGCELPPGPVVVTDPVGDAVGVGVAELLAGQGRQTTIVSQDQVIGTQLALTGDLADANTRLQRAGVTLAKRSLLREVHAGHVVLEDVFTARRRELDAAVVIHCGHRLPDGSLSVAGATRAGDCVAPRTIHEAILEGRRAALTLAAATPVPAGH